MVSILLDKMDVCESILATDGDDDTMKLLRENILSTGASHFYCCVVLFIVLYCTVLYCTVLYCTVLYCTVLYCTVLYCTVLYCTVLYCTVL